RLQDTVPLGGTLNAHLNFTMPEPGALPQGEGKLQITNLSWKGTITAADVSGDLALKDGVLSLPVLRGEIAQGRFFTRLSYNLAGSVGGKKKAVGGNLYLKLDHV